MNYTVKITKKMIFLILWGICVFSNIIRMSALYDKNIYGMLTIPMCVALIVLFISQHKRSLKMLVIDIMLFMLFTLAAFVTDQSAYVMFAAFMISADVADFKSIVKVSLIVTIISTLIIFVVSQVGYIEDKIFYTRNGTAHGYGFSYYSWITYIIFYCIMMYLYLKTKEVKWYELFIIGIINYLLWKNSSVRLTYYLMWIMLLLVMLAEGGMLVITKKSMRIMSRVLFPIGELVIIVAMLFFDANNPIWSALNGILTGRLSLAQNAYKLYSIKLFGNELTYSNISNLNIGYLYVDSGFAYAILGYGVIFTIVIVFLYSVIYDYSCKVNDKFLFIWVTLVFVFTLINDTWLAMTYNPLLLYLPTILKENMYGRIYTKVSNDKEFSEVHECAIQPGQTTISQ